MPRRRKTAVQQSSRSAHAEEEDEPMEEEVAEEEDEVEDGEEEDEDDDGEGSEEGGSGGRGRGGRERPGQRNAANARERARMRVLSRAFCRLKTTLPWVPPDTKLSKLDTLRLATSYIAHLRAMLEAEAEAESAAEGAAAAAAGKRATATAGGRDSPDRSRGRVATLHPLNLTWPFSFQRSSSSSSSSPASSTSSNVASTVPNGPTVITHLGGEWSSMQDIPPNHYCQGNHMSMDTGGHQNRVSPPSHHHLIHHHHPHHFLPSSYPDSSLLHIA